VIPISAFAHRMLGLFRHGVILLLLVVSSIRAEEITIRWVEDSANPRRVTVEISGLPNSTLEKLRAEKWDTPQWQRLFSVTVAQRRALDEIDLPGILGTYSVGGKTIKFVPQFPFDREVTYNATFRPAILPNGTEGQSAQPIRSSHQISVAPMEATTVVAQVYPTADDLPENLLKFYIHFSAPMSGGRIYDHIQMLDAAGKPVELPFLEIDEELWNPQMDRLTLFLDPGRIKRGVRPLEEVGPALRAGNSYTLVIDSSWKDASGNALKSSFEKRFRVSPVDRETIDYNKWQITSPRSGTSQPLVIHFEKPLDHALALRMIRILDSSREAVRGTPETRSNERELAFAPSLVWKNGPYFLSIETTIEDLAGNNIGKPYEVDLFDRVAKRSESQTVERSFQIQ
jgi:hypothetical protein